MYKRQISVFVSIVASAINSADGAGLSNVILLIGQVRFLSLLAMVGDSLPPSFRMIASEFKFAGLQFPSIFSHLCLSDESAWFDPKSLGGGAQAYVKGTTSAPELIFLSTVVVQILTFCGIVVLHLVLLRMLKKQTKVKSMMLSLIHI